MGEETVTFEDSTLWIANNRVPDDVIYNLLSVVYSPEGIDHMIQKHKSAQAMSIETGVKGIVTPLHPGAERFWREKGVR